MNTILITTLVIAAIGLIVGAGLVFMGKKFAVEADPKETEIRAVLPGNNCGACGYAGCDAVAAAIAAGEAPVNACPVGGQAVTDQIGAIMGVSAEAAEAKVAFVRCSGNCDVTHSQANYVGIPDCRSAALSGIALKDCDYGCLGLGSCVSACPQQAISVRNGVAFVNRKKCIGCGLCAKACPKGLIELIPVSKTVAVRCSNRDRGPIVKQVCSAGCIGCGLCQRQCEAGAITVSGNLAHVNYEACVQCGKCVEKCPSKVIVPPVGNGAA